MSELKRQKGAEEKNFGSLFFVVAIVSVVVSVLGDCEIAVVAVLGVFFVFLVRARG